MKLKKIASLALAGVMAVSMLAGCNNGSNNNNNGSNGEVDVVPASAVLNIINSKQSVENKVQIKFTADSALEKYAATAVADLGYKAGNPEDAEAVAKKIYLMSNIVDVAKPGAEIINTDVKVKELGFLTADEEDIKANNGHENTLVYVQAFKDKLTDEAVAYSAMEKLNAVLGALAESTSKNTPDKDYLEYTYTGNACIISSQNENGTPVYYAVFQITQNAAKKTTASV